MVAVGTYLNHDAHNELNTLLMAEMGIGAFIGAITFTGSIIAFAKLKGIMSGSPITFPGQHMVNLALGIAIFVLTWYFCVNNSGAALFGLILFALLLGLLLIIPIGGADMPVVVSMLNSYSGWAAAATGFTLGNHLLIITGALGGGGTAQALADAGIDAIAMEKIP